jgi:hypothetical protein
MAAKTLPTCGSCREGGVPVRALTRATFAALALTSWVFAGCATEPETTVSYPPTPAPSSQPSLQQQQSSQETQQTFQGRRCYFCDGRGWNVCTFCNGTGADVCSLCGGKGWWRGGVSGRVYRCESCGGRGITSCMWCNGQGRSDCSWCVNGWVLR